MLDLPMSASMALYMIPLMWTSRMESCPKTHSPSVTAAATQPQRSTRASAGANVCPQKLARHTQSEIYTLRRPGVPREPGSMGTVSSSSQGGLGRRMRRRSHGSPTEPNPTGQRGQMTSVT